VFAGYFEVAGIPIVEGRSFIQGDITLNRPSGSSTGRRTNTGVVIVNRALARTFWPGQNAIDKRLGSQGIVVGVAENAKEFTLAEDPKPMFYVPAADNLNEMTLIIRTTVDPDRLGPAVRQEIRALDSDLPIERMATMENLIARTYAGERYRTTLMTAFGVAAVLLTLVGVYGVISSWVSRRTRELGIRIATGATPATVMRLVLRETFGVAAVGVLLGLILGVSMTQFLSGFLYGISATDMRTYVMIAIALISVTLLAGAIPASRAARVDPAVCLRAE
jgi:putative ABC transport system permease protein